MQATWKKWLSLGLTLMLLLGCLPTAVLAAEPAIPYHYTSNENSNKQEDDTFSWSDCFSQSSFQGSDLLRLLSAQVSITSASRYGTEEDPYEQDFSDLGYNVKAALTDLGFVDVETNAYYQAETRENSAAVAVGHRTIEADGETYTLLAIIPRSAGYKQEWAGNFTVGDGLIHEGFKAARDEDLRFVKSYLAQHEITGKLKVWITGHSRGSAVANLLGGFFAGGGIAYFGDSVSITPEDVYCYTYATPRTIVAGLEKNVELSVEGNRGGEYALDTVQEPYEYTGGGTVDPADPIYGGIRNYPFSYDFITGLPPAQWGYTWYGGVYSMTETADGRKVSADKMLAQLDAISHFVFEEWTGGNPFPGKYQNYPGDYRSFREMDFDLATLSLVPVEGGLTGEAGMTAFIESFVAGLPALIPTREEYVSSGYEEMMIALAGLYGSLVLQFSDQLLEDVSDLAMPGVLCYLAYAYEELHARDESITEAEAVAIALVELLDYVTGQSHDRGEIPGITVDEFLPVAFGYLAEQGLLYLDDPESSPLMMELLPALEEAIPAEYAPLVGALLGGAVPLPEGWQEEETYSPELEESLIYFMLACTQGAAEGSLWADSEEYDDPEEARGYLYNVVIIMQYMLDLPAELSLAVAGNGMQPLPVLVAGVLPLLTGKDENEVPLPLAEAADEKLGETLTAMIDGVLAFIDEENIAYSDDFVEDILKHKENLVGLEHPERITMLRHAISTLVFRTDSEEFNTAQIVRKLATFVGALDKIPQAHYNEVFIAWAKAAVNLKPAPAASQPVYYSVTVAETEHGSVTVSDPAPVWSQPVTLTLIPEEGYEAESVTVRELDVVDLQVTKNADGTYSFTQLNYPVTVHASFVKKIIFRFTDVAEGTYYYAPVYWAVQHEVTDGTSETTFSPEETATRAQMVTFVWRAKGSPEPTVSETPFADLDENEYYYKAVLWAWENGLTDGTAPDTFSPEDTVTRAQAVTFLYRALAEPLTEDTSAGSASAGRLPGLVNGDSLPEPPAPEEPAPPFTDLDPQEYYYRAVVWAYEQGFTQDLSDTAFRPEEDCLRQDIVTFLYRAFCR